MEAARAFRSPASGRLVPPLKSCMHRVLSELDPDATPCATSPPGGRKVVPSPSTASRCRSNRPGGPDEDRMFVVAVEHGSGRRRTGNGRGGAHGAAGADPVRDVYV